MAKKELILDPSQIDLDHVIADIEEIHKYNPQRFEMEQLTAVCYEDVERGICVGYKDLTPDEFWIRGHMPGMPLMPGVIMCEASAQLASYFALKHQVINAEMIGFGGLEDVRFRGVVPPGERFVIVAQLLKAKRMILTCRFECFVRNNLVCEGILKGIPLSKEMVDAATAELKKNDS
ncbi:MAG: beta-hydroxyacyl-ACP dehydratase [Planctomycetota bacterium]|nr:MAG: beta-hydroxyacyl-ACP dehydratase [Planctomycetota bacterium]